MNKKFLFVFMTLVIVASIVFSPAVVPDAPNRVVHGANPAATAPIADFTGDPTWGPPSLQVDFSDQSSGDPTGWAWYFGDEILDKPWTQMTRGAEWTARSGHSSVSLPDGSIVLMGGSYYNRQNDVWRSTDQGATWTQITPAAPWSPRHSHTSVVLPDGNIVLMGGYVGWEGKNDVWRSTDQGATWTQMTDSALWGARYGHSSVALPDGSIVLMGGIAGNIIRSDVWRSTDQGATWTQVPAATPWEGRYGHTSVVLSDGNIVLMGGDAGWGRGNDVWRSPDQGATWIQMTGSAPWGAREGLNSVALPDGSIVLMGGYRYEDYYHNDVWRSTDQGATWTQVIQAAEWTVRHYHTSVVLPDGSIVLMGGGLTMGSYPRNDVWRSTDQGANWTQMTAAAPWRVRSRLSSVALHDGAIILMGGGYIDLVHRLLNDVWRSTDQGATWTQMTAAAPWRGRWGHSSLALPDGSIVLMGGYYYDESNNYLNDVWCSTDQGATWRLMTAAAPWSARTNHTSVVLPNGDIVLMGGNDWEYHNDIWRSTDQGATWTQMTAAAPWTARWGHSSVPLPDGSIVLMGGYDGNRRSDVWRSTDQGATWTQMTVAAPWTARNGHTSVALPDGSIILVGGYDGSDRNDVWRSTDQGATWTQVTFAAPWKARRSHTSVALLDGSIVLLEGDSGLPLEVWRLETAGSYEQHPTHIYTKLGTYSVTLQVYNADAVSSTTRPAYINVTDTIPDPDPDGFEFFLPLILH